MRVIVFFDLPVLTAKNRRDYRQFRKYLIKNGFLMEQESVYSKLAPNSTVADTIIYNVKKHKSEEGLIEALKVTERQYENIVFICGKKQKEVLDTNERLVII